MKCSNFQKSSGTLRKPLAAATIAVAMTFCVATQAYSKTTSYGDASDDGGYWITIPQPPNDVQFVDPFGQRINLADLNNTTPAKAPPPLPPPPPAPNPVQLKKPGKIKRAFNWLRKKAVIVSPFTAVGANLTQIGVNIALLASKVRL